MTRARLVALLWTLAILAACSIPGSDLPEIDIFSFDKLAHGVVFAGYGWLWLWALNGTVKRKAVWVLLTGTAYAVLTEVYQGFLPIDRTPDAIDALADIAGLALGVLLFHALQASKRTREDIKA